MIRRLAGIAVLLATLAPLPAPAGRWSIAPGEGQVVGFHSKAPLESFDGTTSNVRGFVRLDEGAPGDSLVIEIRVDMASLDTGIGMRNRHMRENHLHTDRFPEAVFRGGRIVSGGDADLRDGAGHEVRVEGTLEVHGVSRARTIPLHLTLADGEGAVLRIAAEFPVALADHDIPRPSFLFAKLGEVQKVYAELFADVEPDSASAAAGN